MMKPLAALTLFVTLLPNDGRGLLCQTHTAGLLSDVWKNIPSDLRAADSVAYSLLDAVKQGEPASDTLYANLFYLLGTLEFYKKRYLISANFYEQALATPYLQNNRRARLDCLNNLGGSLMRLGRTPEALEAFQRAMSIARELGDQASVEDLWVNIAELESDLGEYEQAVMLATKALQAAELQADTFKMARSLLNLGKYLVQLKQLDPGERHTRRAIRFFEDLGDSYHLAAALLNLSSIEQGRKNYVSSDLILQRVVRLVAGHESANSLAPVYIQLCNNALALDSKVDVAKGYALEAIRLAESSRQRDYLEEATLALGKCHAKMKDFDNFDRTIERYREIKLETTTLQAKAASEELKIIYDLDQLNSHNRELQQHVHSKNQLLAMLSLAFLMACSAGTIIFFQHRKLKRYVKTMFQMNINLAYSSREGKKERDAPTDDPTDNPDVLTDRELFKLILRKIELKALYKNPDLSLADLAKQVRRNKVAVSKAIKHAGKTNFAGLLNEFKVNEARRLLLDQNSPMSMGDIALASGFNSRTSFNRHFKELTGFTPTDYLRLMNRTADTAEEVERS